MRFIGSINGDMGKYSLLTSNSDESLQLGDLGIDLNKLIQMAHLIDPNKHKLLSGNTDYCSNSDIMIFSSFGTYQGVFLIGGGAVEDKESKVLNLDYFEGRELLELEHGKVIALYKETMPEIVATYEIPYFLYSYLNKPIPQKSVTQRLLERLLDIHRPRTWIFNNRVTGARIEYPQTTFIGLGEGEFIDIEVRK